MAIELRQQLKLTQQLIMTLAGFGKTLRRMEFKPEEDRVEVSRLEHRPVEQPLVLGGEHPSPPVAPVRRIGASRLHQAGIEVLLDVVYNHTNASGQDEKSVLDRIVPGYYHRLNDKGQVETSTCCQNTASEHNMMEKLMVDSLVTWATEYKIDAFRFDLMGHHMKRNMIKVRETLDSLSLAEDGVNGAEIYMYGEGWNFGEVADNARGVNATQLNMAGTGIGTFSDRLRDAVRGVGPFDSGEALRRNQGFANGLFYDHNAFNSGSSEELEKLLLFSDQIRVGMAGNLADYEFIDHNGDLVTGKDVDYNGQPAGYTQDPQEDITYISKHDNQTLYDNNTYKNPVDTSMADRVRVQNVGLSTVLLGQGVPFMHAGSDLLRSKSFDRDSYNSGDWFNRLDFTYQANNYGVGLPVAGKNQDNWVIMQPRLANPDLKLRVYISGGGCSGFQYGFTFDEAIEDGDSQVENQGVKLLVDPMSVQYLMGAEIDYKEDLQGAQFIIRNPNAQTTCGCGSSFSV